MISVWYESQHFALDDHSVNQEEAGCWGLEAGGWGRVG